MNAPIRIDPDPKRAKVLDGAMRVFLTYGYQRVTMEDIARAAEISRPALYLLFKNKADIYRALGAALLERSAETAEEELAKDGAFVERMLAAIDRSLIAMMKTIIESPHGAELLDHKNTLAADLAALWRDHRGAPVIAPQPASVFVAAIPGGAHPVRLARASGKPRTRRGGSTAG